MKPITDERWEEILNYHNQPMSLKLKPNTPLERELANECVRLRDVNERLTTTIREAAGKFWKAAHVEGDWDSYTASGVMRITQAAEEIENE